MRTAVLALSSLGLFGGCDAVLSRPAPDMEPAAHDGTGRLDQTAVDSPAGDGPVDGPPAADGSRPDGAPTTTGQCAVSAPPAAQAAGLTKLAFCDDFGDPSTFDFKGTGNPGFKWYRNYWFSFSQTTKPEAGEPESSFTIKNGVLELKTQNSHYQSNFQSAILKDKKPVGYYIDRETGGWYVEAGLAHFASADGVGLWSMDMCHIYAYPTACDRFVEPDWYEFWTGGEARATHLWVIANGKAKKLDPDCNNWWKNSFDPAQLRTYAALTSSSGVTYWRDDQQVGACNTMPWKNEVVAGPPGLGQNAGRYPILIGTKPGHSLKVDFVRVWVKP